MAGAGVAGAGRRAVVLFPSSMGSLQPPGLLAAPVHDDSDEAMDQWCFVFFKHRLQHLDHDLPIRTVEAEGVQDDALRILCQPPLGPTYCLQLLVQPGQHGIEETLLSLEKCCPDLEEEATHGLRPCSPLLGW